MFTISVQTCFWASHRLVLPDGVNEPVHAHNWSVTVEVGSKKLNDMDVVMDFHELKEMVDNITDGFNNKALNDMDCFQKNNPSAETVAKYIYDRIGANLPQGVKLRNVKVVEQTGCSAKFGD
ncbi:MAG: 6-carboxytetrahydropterin synthase [Sedimentisphaerales bacterium]|nr:6-carboxytetrahydropterin synthase [Sedimentisphaerales bacterium]